MSVFVRRVVCTVAVALGPMAYVAAVSSGVASAQPPDCGAGNWWNPGANACQPVAPPPLIAVLAIGGIPGPMRASQRHPLIAVRATGGTRGPTRASRWRPRRRSNASR